MASPADLGGREPVLALGPELPARVVIGREAEVAIRAADIPVRRVPQLGNLDLDREDLSALEAHVLLGGMTAEAVLLLGL
jgi:hypothetical protein